MVESADLGQGKDASLRGWLNGARLGSILLECEMRAGTVVVAQVAAQMTTKVSLIQDDHVVEELATNGADHAFAEGIRLWRTHRCFQDFQAHRLKRAVNAFATVGFSTAHVPAFRRVGAGEHQ